MSGDITSPNMASSTFSGMSGNSNDQSANQSNSSAVPDALPSINLPKGGGSMRDIGEKFSVSAATGTASTTVPIPISASRSGFNPSLSISYDSGSGNSPFGFGWSLSLPSISRKTDKGLPLYQDDDESDVFLLSGVEDLVPLLQFQNDTWTKQAHQIRELDGVQFEVRVYHPRIEGSFARIERWTHVRTREIQWRTVSGSNVVIVYGDSNSSRVYDHCTTSRAHPHIFRWLPSRSYDDRGNIFVYEYKSEDSEGVDLEATSELNRTHEARSAQRYLKRVKYGNRVSHLLDPKYRNFDWMFEVVFDYGEHPGDQPNIHETKAWDVRPDSFSSYRSCFEVRTYRLCRRVLLFHHFPDEENVGRNCLVSSLEFSYHQTPAESLSGGNRVASFISAITQRAYQRSGDSYLHRALPPTEFEYSQPNVSREIRDLDPAAVENLPYGLDDAIYRWLDLDGEGVPGILTKQGGCYFYKPNHGNGNFGSMKALGSMPQSIGDGSRDQWMDIAGDGHLSLVQFGLDLPGFYSRSWSMEELWESFTPFESMPTNLATPGSVKYLDLTGDGLTDVLIANDEVLTWYPSLGRRGYGEGRYSSSLSEDTGARLLLSDSVEALYTADMSGDGLADLVRIRNGEICYWPNLGYGSFGRKVMMENSPFFDYPDIFDQTRLRLFDIDGSGTTDVLYLAANECRYYQNHAGNGWSDAHCISIPAMSSTSQVQVIDLLGRGTGCLVWSSPLHGDSGRQIRYIDLMAEGKPYMLVLTTNNRGSETRIHYASSTQFYLQDKLAGKPWITHLPFPVQVVERVETFDHISRNYFVTRYAYHHGFYDGIEREFRGFGMVEQWDTEEFESLTGAARSYADVTNIDAASSVPPILTRTWFHTGAAADGFSMASQYRSAYYKEPELSDENCTNLLLDHTRLSPSVKVGQDRHILYHPTVGEEREAFRALKGLQIRQEIYGKDNSDLESQPYQVSESSYHIRMIQPRAFNKHAVFISHKQESVGFQYDRKLYRMNGRVLADPKTTHSLTLEVDEFGNVLLSATLGYGRRHLPAESAKDLSKQKQFQMTYASTSYTHGIFTDSAYRLPLPAESLTYQILNYSPPSTPGSVGLLLRPDVVRNVINRVVTGLYDLPFSDFRGSCVTDDGAYRRLIGHQRTIYRKDDFSAALPLRDMESLALTFETYKKAFPGDYVAEVYKDKLSEDELQRKIAHEGGYVTNQGDGDWWIPSGKVFYSPDPHDSAQQEREYARKHFFLPHRFQSPFHTKECSAESFVTYDKYNLLTQEKRDALDNRITVGERNIDPKLPLLRAGHDYRVLKPFIMMDPNRNRSEVAFDILGLVVGSAAMGKPEETVGDSLEGFSPNLDTGQIQAYFKDPIPYSHSLLVKATSRFVYDHWRFYNMGKRQTPQPVVASTLVRETHVSDLVGNAKTKIMVNFTYIDGLGRQIQQKMQAEPESFPKRRNSELNDEQPTKHEKSKQRRWVGSGWKIFNNKGKPIREYEPFFTTSFDFEFNFHFGVSAVHYYDPAERPVAVLLPDHTWTKVVYDPWRQETWDANDTVLTADPKDDPDVGDFFRRLPESDYLPTWYESRIAQPSSSAFHQTAIKTAIHAATPTVIHSDVLGHPIITVAHNRFNNSRGLIKEEFYSTKVEFDYQGNKRQVEDAKGRIISCTDYNMLGNVVYTASMEAGSKWTLSDVSQNPLFAWNSRGIRLRSSYDCLRRTKMAHLQIGSGPESTVGHTYYGEELPNPEARNCRGKVVKLADQAGLLRTDKYDFKGNSLQSLLQLAKEYKSTLDWSGNVPLEDTVYSTETKFDALNRTLEITAPDKSRLNLVYNEANLLHSVSGKLRGSQDSTCFIKDIQYDARGKRTSISHGNGTRTIYKYDALIFRLISLQTRRHGHTGSSKSRSRSRSGSRAELQNLQYTYDPAGNVTHIHDDSQEVCFFRNRQIHAGSEYEYDAVYRLVKATGREHIGQADARLSTPRLSGSCSKSTVRLEDSNDAKAMTTYNEHYIYDFVGNILSMQHQGHDPSHSGWTQTYNYNESSLLQNAEKSNRLTSTKIGSHTESYGYSGNAGLNGNMTSMPGIPNLEWDYRDQLHATPTQTVNNGSTPETMWYTYDAGGQRRRKITERYAASGEKPTGLNERIYLGIFEIYREFGGDGETVSLERETLQVTVDGRAEILVETRTVGTDSSPKQLLRYQYHNLLGSSVLELDEQAQVISYEEYYVFGGTSYRAVSSRVETPKRYRFSGKERDDGTGLYYFGARYYASWLGRWTAPDPAGTGDGTNLYVYARDNPVTFTDQKGTEVGQPEVISLGRWEQLGRWTDTLLAWGGRALNVDDVKGQLQKEAGENTGLVPKLLDELPGFYDYKRELAGVGKDNGQYSGLMSGMATQHALEGPGNVEAIHMDTTGVSPLDKGQTAGELRNLITAIESEANTEVDIHFFEDGKLSTIPRGTSTVVGAPLPERISNAMPSFNARQAAATAVSEVATVVESGVETFEKGAEAVLSTVEESAGAVVQNPEVATKLGVLGTAGAMGTALGKVAIDMVLPGVREFVQFGGHQVLAGYATQALRVAAAAVEAAPAAAAATAVVSGVAGGVVGHYVGNAVEEATGSKAAGVASGVASGAVTGALVGAAIGSIVPGLGTAAGAVIGGAVGAIGGFIGSYW